MEKVRYNDKTKYIAVLVICLLVFAAAVFGVFFTQSEKLTAEFDRLVADNLEVCVQGQKNQVNSMLGQAKNMLAGVGAVIETSDLELQREWIESYLKQLQIPRSEYQVDFVGIDELSEDAEAAAEGTDKGEFARRLLSGQEVISDFYNTGLSGQDDRFFMVARPVYQNGTMIGALRATISASLLLAGEKNAGLFQKSSMLLVRHDGEIVYADTHYESTGDLFSSMEKNGIRAEDVRKIEESFGSTELFTRYFEGKGNVYFMSAIDLGVNRWYLVQFVRSPDVRIQSGAVLHSLIVTGVILICLTALTVVVMASVFLGQRKRLSREQQRYTALSQFSDTILFEYSVDEDAVEFTSNAKARLHLDQLCLRGISGRGYELCVLHPDDQGVLTAIFHPESVKEDGETGYTEGRMKGCDGKYYWFGCTYKYLLNGGRVERVIGKLADITDRRGREEMLKEQAQKDMLTCIYNRAGEQLIRGMLRRQEQGCFFMIDLDHLKKINDECGHMVGDAFLRAVGAVLSEVFGSEGIAARIGGDEFVAFVPEAGGETAARRRARLLLDGISSIALEETGGQILSASIGIALCPQDGTGYEELYLAADQALYAAKHGGRGGFAFYSCTAADEEKVGKEQE
ncbi:diguanylate cyclase [Bacilliculturomica massiliensis]|uniref:diguanylate cyclase n=1 Tax=Bacilliculturomica massiliensis TaxID=1917867 RepID=UPI0013EF056C|nr:diguanylate cyclase [Bacilliculturomica massiliensis]